ncbi:MAG TPA: crosslink repair DNA glycosylase YcaQ family protein, partial [bacterium]|nr:crosslink repair DNA glycosylase YcaQ family protein [bacterium]
MPTPTPVKLSRGAARRFLIEHLGLTGDSAYASRPRASASRVLDAIRRLEAVQLDPVAAVERNQHLVLGARLTGYSPRTLERLLEGRAVFEYWANAACVLPIEEYWMFEG